MNDVLIPLELQHLTEWEKRNPDPGHRRGEPPHDWLEWTGHKRGFVAGMKAMRLPTKEQIRNKLQGKAYFSRYKIEDVLSAIDELRSPTRSQP